MAQLGQNAFMELNLDENKNKKCIENIGFASGGIFEIKKYQIIGYLWIFYLFYLLK